MYLMVSFEIKGILNMIFKKIEMRIVMLFFYLVLVFKKRIKIIVELIVVFLRLGWMMIKIIKIVVIVNGKVYVYLLNDLGCLW